MNEALKGVGSMPGFDFGENWRAFLNKALTLERVKQARRDFTILAEGIPLAGRTFLDIGFGQGLSLLAAAAEGARVFGCDVNPTCAAVLEANRQRFAPAGLEIPVVVGSILDTEVLDRLREMVAEENGFDVVHSWGVLHHTGDLWTAVQYAGTLVRPGGALILALYNRHWSSPVWWWIKRLYNTLPGFLRPLVVRLLLPVLFVAKLAVTGSNPVRKSRGMDFFYDVVDWIGGFPYEYAGVEEVTKRVAGMGFRLSRLNPAEVPTGCNEFVFRKVSGE